MTTAAGTSQADVVRLRDATARNAIGGAWTRNDIPNLAGRMVLVTGGTRGLGRAVATALAEHGAQVTITGTDPERARASAEAMNKGLRARGIASAEVLGAGLDLTDLDSVAALGRSWTESLDLVVNNAGIMWGPYASTRAGVERQLATNFLGHFALVGHLWPRLAASRGARVVSLSSTYHQYGGLTARDLEVTASSYKANRAYGTSKLAMLAFAKELGRRAHAQGFDVTSVAAHPGYANTDLQTSQLPTAQRTMMRLANHLLAVPVETGADPILCAATVPDLPSGVFVGPSRLKGYRGRPGIATSIPAAEDRVLARNLWAWATDRTQVCYLDQASEA